MRSADRDESTVWSKGDQCMSPYSGDNEQYRGVIQKFKRSLGGEMLALVKFDGYDDDDMEEVKVDQLEKVKVNGKVKGRAPTRKTKDSPALGGMFSPLQGSELSQRLKSKYESDEEEEISVKSKKLSSVLFGNKSPGSSSKASTPGNKSRKPVVVTGGEPLKGGNSSSKPPEERRRYVEPDSPGGSRPRKCQLNITGGHAKDLQNELITSKRLSDISSIVDSEMVKKALQRHTDHTLSSSDDEESSNMGFNEEDMEKPKFTFKPEGVKVPLILSGEDETPVVQVPRTLNQFLRDYQHEGIKFLYSHYVNDRGAILGDDMGLGKTVQVIGFLSALLGKQGNRVDVMRQKPRFIRKLSDSASVRRDTPSKGPFLIIGPGCVLYNWLEELETWGYFSVRKYHGTDKADCLKEIKKGKLEIIVTTFETFREHMADLNSVDWDAVIVDEVHKIKDMKARTTKALREINTRRRFGLTGTALQNNLLEFWSILDWAQPGCLGSQADFVHEFVRPIESGQRHDANKRELATARKQKDRLAEIRKTMMIRRVKSIIADQLPKKDDSVVFCKLSQLQVSIYKTILDQPGMDFVIHGDDPCACDSGEPQSQCCKQKTPDGQSIKSLRFTFMHLLLKTSNHVALLIPTEKTSERQATTARKICKAALSKHPEFVAQTKEASFKTLSDPKYCGKMKILQGLLKVFYREHSKVLVFSYSTQVLDIIEQHLMSTGYEYRRIDGSVSSKKRMIVVREFNKDPNIFICLISTKAGGLGLNLTGANKVVIFDPNWNPTHDLQAQDRAYRIGQRRDVQVYRLISTGTIEENMYLRQIYKQQLLNVTVEDENAKRYFYAVQGNRNQKGEIFGVKNMFILRTGESCITRDIIKRNERVESALEGFDTAQYVSPVVRIEDDEEYDDVTAEGDSAEGNSAKGISANSPNSEDLFAQFFSSSDESDLESNKREIEEIDSSDMEENKSVISRKSAGKHNNKNKSCRHKAELSVRECKEVKGKSETEKHRKLENKKQPKVRFQSPPKGKVTPSESRTGKGPARRNGKHSAAAAVDGADDDDDDNVLQYDQTLAGTFADVADVFDNCGVVHIHKNVKVVGGSRAEDHMSKCAISDVYELNQHSQDLAAQCEPMSESSEEEQPVVEKKRRGQSAPLEDHNTVRSTMVGNTKYLIGQTPKTFRLKNFEELSKHLNTGSLLDFAELVLSSSLEERVEMLNRFYKSKDPALQDIHKLKNYTPGSRETCREVRKNYSRSKYEKAQKKNEIGHRRTTPSSSRVGSRIVQGVSFLDDIEPDSESLSQQKSDTARSDSNSVESSMEVGRKVSPRKRVHQSPNRKLVKKCKVATKSVHEAVPSTYYEDYDSMIVRKYRYGKETEAAQESVVSEDLLDEIGKISEEAEGDVTHVQEKRKGTQQSVSSVLDDVFGGIDSSAKLNKKPPPSKKIKTNSPIKRMRHIKKEKDENLSSDDDDPFKVVDEIFGYNTDRRKQNKKPSEAAGDKIDYKVDRNENASNRVNEELIEREEDDEVCLEDSTLKDDNYDCFDDPKLWRKRKRKEPDKRNIVDRLIDDSNADFNDLFTSGKMKKKASKSEVVNNRHNSESQLDGSASLFS